MHTNDIVMVKVAMQVTEQRLAYLLVGAVEGGSDYWARFSELKMGKFGDDDLDVYASVRVTELEASGERKISAVVTPKDLATGLARASEAGLHHHVANFLNEDDDAETADVILQMTVLGELVYG